LATVTFLFADQVGSTAQLQALGDTGATGVRQALFDVLREAVDDHNGEVIDHTGDGLMVAFGSAVDAVGCAVAVQQAAHRHNLRSPAENALQLRVGINTGEPVVNDEGRYFGIAVVIAARLCQVAAGGQILGSDVVRALAEPRRLYRFSSVGEIAAKGVDDPVSAWQVDWEPEEIDLPLPPALADLAGPLVGRADDLAWLRALWARAAGGHRQAGLLLGEAGVGKTRLVAALATEAHAAGAYVLAGRFDQQPTGPYQGLVEALGAYVEAAPRSELRAQLGKGGGLLARMMPQLAERVPNLVPAGPGGQSERWLMIEAVESFLVAIARTTPTLLVLDDLHWADQDSLILVRQLLRGRAQARLVVLACARDVRVGRSALLAELGVDPRRPEPAHLRSVMGLPLEQVAELLGLLVGETPDEEQVRTVLEQTEGNPYFIHQVAGDLLTRRLALQVGKAVRQATSTRLDLWGVREDIVSGVLEIQRLRQQLPDLTSPGEVDVEIIEPEGASPAAGSSPYKGLLHFEPDDAELFHGREQLVAELVARLVTARFVAVVGASGSGKSSLVRAGLLPTLAAGALPGSDTWIPMVLQPGADPFGALANGLAPLLNGSEVDELRERLRRSADGLDAVTSEALGGGDPDARLVLVVDQFEEVFTNVADDGERDRFIDLLLDAARPDGRVSAVVALRADLYARCAAHAGLAALLGESQVLVGPMTEDELRRAIAEPARRSGLVLQPGLVDVIVSDVAQEPGALPLLSTALEQTWERRRGRSLTLAGYAQTGGVRGAVGRLADGVYDGLDAERQAVARGILLRLTEPGAGLDDLRRRCPLDELGADDPRVAEVLGVLVTRRLVVADERVAEVAHEALLREWPRLRGWLEEDREGRRLHRQLAEASGEWETHGRDSEQLFRGARLGAALDWARTHDDDLSARERAFLDTSRDAHDRQLRSARRTARRLRTLTVGLAGVLVLALVAGTLALVQRGNAQRQAVRADAGRLAALAGERVGRESDLAMLLAVEAHRLEDSVSTRGALLTVVGQSPRLTALRHEFGNDILFAALTPDGKILATCRTDGILRLWDFATGKPRTPPIKASESSFGGVFSPDGRVFATGDGTGILRVWEVATGKPLATRRAHQGPIGFGVYTPDGRQHITAGFDGTIRYWRMPSGAPLGGPVDAGIGPLRSIDITPDGRLLVVGSLGGKLVLVDAASRRLVGRPLQVTEGETTVTFSPDGRTLATTSTQGNVQLWNVATRSARGRPLSGHDGLVRGVRFSPDGSMLASADQSGRIMLWDVTSQMRIGDPLVGHTGNTIVVGFTADGTGLVSSSTEEIATWRLDGATLGTRLDAHAAGGVTLTASSDGRMLATGGADGSARLWDPARRRPIGQPLRTGAPGVHDVALSPDGRLLAAAAGARDATGPGRLLLWDTATRRQVAAATVAPTTAVSLAFTPDGRTLVGGTAGGQILRWGVDGLRPQGQPRTVGAPDAWVTIALSPDGRTLAMASTDVVELTDLATGRKLGDLRGHINYMNGLAFSSDGARLASVGYDGRLILWDVTTRRAIGDPLTSGGGTRWSVALSPDGTIAATTGEDGELTLWDLPNRQQLGRPLPGHHGQSNDAVFLGSDHLLASLGDDGALILWNLDPAAVAAKACALAGRNLTKAEFAQHLGGPYRRTCPQWPEA
jgi:WD40 repeat protein/class 3 adenylate cyclase/energy-coupling factor transporter ATP-binding protein EcfA2